MDDYEYSDDISSPDSRKQPQFQGSLDPPEVDLPVLCQQQELEIQSLKQQLQQKSKELDDLTRLIRKYTNIIPELKAAIGPPPIEKAIENSPTKPLDQSGAEFWDSHLDKKETVNFSFEDIASKGLWILSSSTQNSVPQKSSKLQELKKAGIRGKGKPGKKPESLPPLKNVEINETPPPNKSKLREILRPAGLGKAAVSISPGELKTTVSPDSESARPSKKRPPRGRKQDASEDPEPVQTRPKVETTENPNKGKPQKEEKSRHRKVVSMAN